MAQRVARLSNVRQLGSFLLLVHKKGGSRYWEIDVLRGVAILMMVTYHCAYDLTLFGYYRANVFVGPWRVFARITATLFIMLAGAALTFSYRREGTQKSGWDGYRKYLIRGLKLAGWGMVITLVTWIYMGKVVIIFGILHLVGAVTALAYPFITLGWANLLIAAALIPLGMVLNQVPVSQPWLLLLGLRPRWLFQLDYFPLLPWFGVALLGIFLAQSLYPSGRRRLDLPDLGQGPGVKSLVWLGQRSLAIYLLHQPLLFALFALAQAVGLRNTI
jgi:uncharacterized membrane protein